MKTWGVVGSRSFNDYSLLKIVLDNNRPDIIVSGGPLGLIQWPDATLRKTALN